MLDIATALWRHPSWVEAKLQEGTLAELEQWAKRSLDAETLEAVFKE
jgi:hypothetical protein